MPVLSFAKLVAQTKHYHAIEDCNHAIPGEIVFNPAPTAPAKFGSFKKAFFGHTSHPVVGSWLYVCIKQCWYPGPIDTNQRLIYNNATQVAKVTSEMNCLRWGSGLMDVVYKFISQSIATLGSPSFEIPNMRFTNTALCILENRDTFMIKEAIDDKFVKYLGNNSAAPFAFFKEEYYHRAEFLAFAQHVQYSKTNGKAFIGDFQGK
jgi:hypothetical protein